jgi:hypothetical protein
MWISCEFTFQKITSISKSHLPAQSPCTANHRSGSVPRRRGNITFFRVVLEEPAQACPIVESYEQGPHCKSVKEFYLETNHSKNPHIAQRRGFDIYLRKREAFPPVSTRRVSFPYSRGQQKWLPAGNSEPSHQINVISRTLIDALVCGNVSLQKLIQLPDHPHIDSLLLFWLSSKSTPHDLPRRFLIAGSV